MYYWTNQPPLFQDLFDRIAPPLCLCLCLCRLVNSSVVLRSDYLRLSPCHPLCTLARWAPTPHHPASTARAGDQDLRCDMVVLEKRHLNPAGHYVRSAVACSLIPWLRRTVSLVWIAHIARLPYDRLPPSIPLRQRTDRPYLQQYL